MKDIIPSFYKFPFAYLTCFLCVGIVLEFKIENIILTQLLLSFSILTGVLIYFFKEKLRHFFILFIALVFSSIGAISLKQYNKLNFETKKVSNTFILRVDEFQQKETWSKGIAQVCELESNKLIPTKRKILFYSNSDKPIHKNDILKVNSNLIPIENKNNPGDFNLQLFWKTKGIKEMCFFQEQDFLLLDHQSENSFSKFIGGLNNYFSTTLSKHLKNEELSIAKALILGDKSMLDSEIRNTFSNTGAMHVLAVSGLHVGIILPLFLGFFKLFAKYIKRNQAVVVVVLILWLYALLTGFSPSVIRAVFMFSILSLAQITGKQYNPINVLFFTAFVMLLINPMYFFDIGFQLSYLAMLGIFMFNESVTNWIKIENNYLKFFWDGTAIGISAQMMTAPLTLYYFHQFPNYFALTNLGLIIFAGAILSLGIALFTIQFIPILNLIVGILLFFSIFLMYEFISVIEDLPGAVAYGFNFSIAILVVLTILLILCNKLKINSLNWKLSAFTLLIMVSSVCFFRFDNLQTSHLCVFNNNQLIVTVKKQDKIICFYDLPTDKINKVKMTVSAYLKCYPGVVNYVSIHKKNAVTLIDNSNIKITKSKEGRIIETPKDTIRIVYSNKQIPLENDITMPWIESEKSLTYGAKIYSLQ